LRVAKLRSRVEAGSLGLIQTERGAGCKSFYEMEPRPRAASYRDPLTRYGIADDLA